MRPEGLAGRAAALAIAAALSLACAGLAARLNPPEGPLDEATVASALNEALRVAAERAVDTLSEPGGFSQDSLLRLRLPGALDPLARGLRSVGRGSQVARLEGSLNRAAEEAVGEALPMLDSARRISSQCIGLLSKMIACGQTIIDHALDRSVFP